MKTMEGEKIRHEENVKIKIEPLWAGLEQKLKDGTSCKFEPQPFSSLTFASCDLITPKSEYTTHKKTVETEKESLWTDTANSPNMIQIEEPGAQKLPIFNQKVKLEPELDEMSYQAVNFSSLTSTNNIKKEFQENEDKPELISFEHDVPILKDKVVQKISVEQFKQTSGVIKKNKFFCLICHKNFTSSQSRKKHFMKHFRKKLVLCNCGRFFPQSVSFSRHYFVHLVKKANSCSNSSAKKQKSIFIHSSKNYSSKKPYKCDICLKQFFQKRNLRHHFKFHTGETTTHTCEICFKQFSHLSRLLQHSRVHTGERPYKCRRCFKSFSDKSTLNKHSRIHTGEKPYKCSICFKPFLDNSTLTKHFRIHTGEKPYQCNFCLKQFAQQELSWTY